MKYFYDTEFLEDGKTIEFISIGIVAEDGREYYAVNAECDTDRIVDNKWLMDNVMSSIKHDTYVAITPQGFPIRRWLYLTDPAAKPMSWIARDITDFIGGDRDAELWAWYGAYDHVCLAQIFGKMIDLPNMVPMHTDDLKTLVREAKNKTGLEPRLPKQPDGNHNALADARWNVVRYKHLRGILDG